MFSITFLNAGILLATLATLIPLIIHLFVKNRPIKIYFSSLKFLREILEERKKKITLNQLILLILRMLVILFMVFALAKPVVKLPFAIKENYHPPTAVAFILDTSPSMDYVINQKTQIQHGIDIIKEIQQEMNEHDISFFLTSSNVHNKLKSRLIYGKIPERDFHDINFSWTPEQMKKLIITAEAELEKSRFLHKEIFVISDLQYTELPEDIKTPVTFINTFTDSIRINLSVEKIILRKEPDGDIMRRRVEFEVVNYSPLLQRDQIIRLNLNGSIVAEKMIDLNPFERKSDFFTVLNESIEWNYGFVEVRNERFLPDNRQYFSFYSDPKPKIGVISQAGDIPHPLQILAEIYLGVNGDLYYLNLDNFQLSNIQQSHFIIFYLTSINSRIEALAEELKNNNLRCMYILHPNMDAGTRLFFETNYNLTLETSKDQNLQLITSFHQWHQIVGDFKFNTKLSLYGKPALIVNPKQNNSPLISTDSSPILLVNKDIFVNIDFTKNSQNILTYPAFPIIMYRSFSWISKYDGSLNNFVINDPFPNKHGALKSPSGNLYDVSNIGFRFTEPGIWEYSSDKDILSLDSIGTVENFISYIAVNMADYDQQSKHNPMTNINILQKDNKKIIGQDNKGNEIWKLLIISAIIIIATEMVLVLIFQKKAA